MNVPFLVRILNISRIFVGKIQIRSVSRACQNILGSVLYTVHCLSQTTTPGDRNILKPSCRGPQGARCIRRSLFLNSAAPSAKEPGPPIRTLEIYGLDVFFPFPRRGLFTLRGRRNKLLKNRYGGGLLSTSFRACRRYIFHCQSYPSIKINFNLTRRKICKGFL